jgi:hypothetical protein
LLSEQSPLREEKSERVKSSSVTSTTHSFALRAHSKRRTESKKQIKSSPLTSTTHSFALREQPTPRGAERMRAGQELTLDIHYSQLCSQSKAHSKRRTERARAGQELTLTSTTHSFALRAKPTPRGGKRARADQEVTPDFPHSQATVCAQKVGGDQHVQKAPSEPATECVQASPSVC